MLFPLMALWRRSGRSLPAPGDYSPDSLFRLRSHGESKRLFPPLPSVPAIERDSYVSSFPVPILPRSCNIYYTGLYAFFIQRQLRVAQLPDVGCHKNNSGQEEHTEHHCHCHIVQLQIVSTCRQNGVQQHPKGNELQPLSGNAMLER